MIRFPTIKVDEQKKKRQLQLTSLLPMCMIAGIIGQHVTSLVIQVAIGVFIVFTFFGALYGLIFIRPNKIIGTIELEPEKITIAEESKTTEMEIDKIDSIKISCEKSWSGVTWLSFNFQNQEYLIHFLIRPEFMFRDYEDYCKMLYDRRGAIVTRRGANLYSPKTK